MDNNRNLYSSNTLNQNKTKMSKEDKKIADKLLKTANEIHKKGLAKANYIHLSAKFIQERADEEGVTFDEMVKIIEEELKPKKRNCQGAPLLKMSKEYIKEQHQHLQLLSNNITPFRPSIGFYVTVDGLEISEDYFPEEYEQIQNAWYSAVKKIKKLNKDE